MTRKHDGAQRRPEGRYPNKVDPHLYPQSYFAHAGRQGGREAVTGACMKPSPTHTPKEPLRGTGTQEEPLRGKEAAILKECVEEGLKKKPLFMEVPDGSGHPSLREPDAPQRVVESVKIDDVLRGCNGTSQGDLSHREAVKASPEGGKVSQSGKAGDGALAALGVLLGLACIPKKELTLWEKVKREVNSWF